MKILQVMPDLELAGAQTMLENLVMELKKNNDVEIIIFYKNKTKISERLENNNVKIHYLCKKRGFDISIFFKIANIIKTYKPDVIHTHRYALAYVVPSLRIIKKVKEIKIVHTIHNVAEKEVPKKIQKMQNKWFKKDNIIPVAISEQVKETVIKRYNIDSKKVPIIYNGIDLSKCKIKNNYSDCTKILHVGRFSVQKNHMKLIEIFSKCLKENNNLKLYLVGSGELENEVKNRVKELNLDSNVIFCGSLESSFDIMSKSDIFVLPSKWEGMPMTLIEAMGTALPCVAFPVGGITDMISNKYNGFLPKNDEEFVQDILMLSKDENLRRNIGEAAKEKSEIYSSKSMADKYIKLYSLT